METTIWTPLASSQKLSIHYSTNVLCWVLNIVIEFYVNIMLAFISWIVTGPDIFNWYLELILVSIIHIKATNVINGVKLFFKNLQII